MYKNRDVSDYINDILTAISDIESFTSNMSGGGRMLAPAFGGTGDFFYL